MKRKAKKIERKKRKKRTFFSHCISPLNRHVMETNVAPVAITQTVGLKSLLSIKKRLRLAKLARATAKKEKAAAKKSEKRAAAIAKRAEIIKRRAAARLRKGKAEARAARKEMAKARGVHSKKVPARARACESLLHGRAREKENGVKHFRLFTIKLDSRSRDTPQRSLRKLKLCASRGASTGRRVAPA